MKLLKQKIKELREDIICFNDPNDLEQLDKYLKEKLITKQEYKWIVDLIQVTNEIWN